MLVVLVYFLIAALATAEEEIWEDFTSHHYSQNATEQWIWNRFADWIFDYSRITKLIENTDWERIPHLNTNNFVCHLGRLGHLSSIQRSGPAHMSDNGNVTGLKLLLTFGHLEFKFSNCTFYTRPNMCPSWKFKFDFHKPNGVFRSNSIYLEINWNRTAYPPPRCNATIDISSVDLGKVIMRNHTPLVYNDCRISDEFFKRTLPEIRNATIRIIHDKLHSILEQMATTVVDVCSLFAKMYHKPAKPKVVRRRKN